MHRVREVFVVSNCQRWDYSAYIHVCQGLSEESIVKFVFLVYPFPLLISKVKSLLIFETLWKNILLNTHLQFFQYFDIFYKKSLFQRNRPTKIAIPAFLMPNIGTPFFGVFLHSQFLIGFM